LTALRYQLRETRAWESASKAHNAEYFRQHSNPDPGQSRAIKELLASQAIVLTQFVDMHRSIKVLPLPARQM
jgi:hypothetical protein